ncbi:LOB domain-containing protein 2 [Prunus dulcis]|uniref:LOB domain-containing protein 2 n=1 Tax=Prunus dulcis TaxID=3755 RepID=A0A4Y1R9R4_PRUDU|nr:LOB domain-containing protein 2 [Prunus dulcis]
MVSLYFTSMSMGSGNGGELNSRHACSACRHQRKKCDDDCVMAPYFTAEKEEAFRAVHKIFGVSNTSKLLKKLEDKNHRGRAAESFIWEACTWKQDPVNGPLGKYRQLEREIALLRDALQRQQEQQEQEEEQEKDCLALPSSTVEQESIALDQGSNNGSDMTYGYANQNLAPANGTYSSLLQGQEVLIISQQLFHKGQQALGQGRQETQRVIGFGPPLMPFDPTIQGGNGSLCDFKDKVEELQDWIVQ